MTLQKLKLLARSGTLDTILVALPDPFGRLVGKRFRADVFLDSIAATLAALRPEVKQELIASGALMPTLQMIWLQPPQRVRLRSLG